MSGQIASDEVAAAFGKFFFGGAGPRHTALTRIFTGCGYHSDDPYDRATGTPNKEDRVLAVFAAAKRRPAKARDLVDGLLGLFRVDGYFAVDPPDGVEHHVKTLRTALRRTGWDLTDSGDLASLGTIDLETGGRAALEEQIARIRRSTEDPGALIGSAKDLLESVAKFVLEGVGMPVTGKPDFPRHLHLARERLGLLPKDVDVSKPGGDAIRTILQSSQRIADQVNALRNVEGVGHGRTLPTGVSPEMAMYVIREAVSSAEFMLATLRRQYGV